MLRNACENCWGIVGGCEKENCDNGYIKYDDDLRVFVTAYEVTRMFGGCEEGGWWYNHYEPIETIPCMNKYSSEMEQALEEKYAGEEYGDIYSMRGGIQIEVYIEKEACEHQTKQAPIYE